MSVNQNLLNPIINHLRKERDAALDALTVTQEEWLLRTKALEAENYKLKSLLLLTDPAVSHIIMNDLTTTQWTEFTRWKEQK